MEIYDLMLEQLNVFDRLKTCRKLMEDVLGVAVDEHHARTASLETITSQTTPRSTAGRRAKKNQVETDMSRLFGLHDAVRDALRILRCKHMQVSLGGGRGGGVPSVDGMSAELHEGDMEPENAPNVVHREKAILGKV